MVVASIATMLERRAPRVYRAARPPWIRLLRLLGRPTHEGYWEKRRAFAYYTEVVRLARAHASEARTALDVGANDAHVLSRIDWLERRVALDRRRPILPQSGVETVLADFMDYRAEGGFDLVLCLQVLEHLEEPAPFAQRLLATGRVVIISVPYMWPAGASANHIQDPVDEALLKRWTCQDPVETSIVADEGMRRLVAVFEGSAGRTHSGA